MRPVTIIHSADLHLDSPFEALGSAKAAVRRGEQRALPAELAALAGREHADLLLLCGDLFDSGNCHAETADELLRALGNVPCPVFIAPGNHDWYGENTVWGKLKLPENVRLFRENRIRFVSVPEADARVYGAAFTARSCGPLLRGFHAERRAGVWNILCMHGDPGNPSSPYNPITEEELAASGMDYVALGHIHKASGLQQAGGTAYSWPGCPEGRGFDEDGEKTVNIVELTSQGCRLRTASVASRNYRKLELDITGKDPLLLIHTSLPDDSVRDVYRITLTGETEQAPDLRRLQQNLDEMFFALQLRDRTRPPRDLWEGVGEDSLRGLFLKKLRKLYDDAQGDAQKRRVEQAARWGIAALENGEEVAIHENP